MGNDKRINPKLVLIRYTFNTNFEYDPGKSEANLRKHGISLEAAGALWKVMGVEGEARTEDEPRFLRIGKVDEKFYSCIFTLRGEVIRLISARRSRVEEQKIYEEALKNEKAE